MEAMWALNMWHQAVRHLGESRAIELGGLAFRWLQPLQDHFAQLHALSTWQRATHCAALGQIHALITKERSHPSSPRQLLRGPRDRRVSALCMHFKRRVQALESQFGRAERDELAHVFWVWVLAWHALIRRRRG